MAVVARAHVDVEGIRAGVEQVLLGRGAVDAHVDAQAVAVLAAAIVFLDQVQRNAGAGVGGERRVERCQQARQCQRQRPQIELAHVNLSPF